VRERFSEAQILGFLREAAAGTSVMELCWNHCFSRSTFRAWKARYGEAIDAELGRLKQLELENARLRNALARANSDLERLRRKSSDAARPKQEKSPGHVTRALDEARRTAQPASMRAENY
jgi:putative transposase